MFCQCITLFLIVFPCDVLQRDIAETNRSRERPHESLLKTNEVVLQGLITHIGNMLKVKEAQV